MLKVIEHPIDDDAVLMVDDREISVRFALRHPHYAPHDYLNQSHGGSYDDSSPS